MTWNLAWIEMIWSSKGWNLLFLFRDSHFLLGFFSSFLHMQFNSNSISSSATSSWCNLRIKVLHHPSSLKIIHIHLSLSPYPFVLTNGLHGHIIWKTTHGVLTTGSFECLRIFRLIGCTDLYMSPWKVRQVASFWAQIILVNHFTIHLVWNVGLFGDRIPQTDISPWHVQGWICLRPKQCSLKGKSLKITIHVYCLIPPI